MMRALFAGVSGLRNHQVRMDVIGNNIANVNTVAFKSSRVTFAESFNQLLQGATRPPANSGGRNPTQIGNGMNIASIDTKFTQGTLLGTGVKTDVAITGEAFFVVKGDGKSLYTRAGNFQFDANGRVTGSTTRETWDLELQNSKDIDIVLDIRRNFTGDWSLTTDAKYDKVDAAKVKFVLPLKAREKQKFSYELTTRHGSNVTK